MYKIALIGAGGMGQRRAHIVNRNKETSLQLVVDSNDSKAKNISNLFNCEFSRDPKDIWSNSDIDAVIISTYHSDLVELAMKAVRAGKHVFCEKPMAKNYSDALSIMPLLRQSNIVFQVGYSLRCYPAIIEAIRIANEGSLGKLLTIRSVYGHGGRIDYAKEWRFKKEYSGGGQLIDQGSHLIDLVNCFMDRVTYVSATLKNLYWKNEDDVEDYLNIELHSMTGQVACINASWTQWRNKFEFEITFEKGYIIVQGLNGAYGPQSIVIGKRETHGEVPSEIIHTYDLCDAFEVEWNNFITAIKGIKEVKPSFYDGLEVLKVIESCYRSQEEKRLVMI